MSSFAETPPKPAIILDGDEENQELGVGVDFDGDGKPDIEVKITIKDPRIWAVIGWVLFGISITKNAGIW